MCDDRPMEGTPDVGARRGGRLRTPAEGRTPSIGTMSTKERSIKAALGCSRPLWGYSRLLFKGGAWAPKRTVSKLIVVPLRQNACKFWRLENTRPNLHPKWCSRLRQTPDFQKTMFSCKQSDMFSNSVWAFRNLF